MNDKEMTAHIKALTKVIERQAEYAEQLTRNFTAIYRQLSHLTARISRAENLKVREDE